MDNQKLLAHSIPRPFIIGIKPIPNVQEKRQEMLAKYRAETIDIEDVEYEKADLACLITLGHRPRCAVKQLGHPL